MPGHQGRACVVVPVLSLARWRTGLPEPSVALFPFSETAPLICCKW